MFHYMLLAPNLLRQQSLKVPSGSPSAPGRPRRRRQEEESQGRRAGGQHREGRAGRAPLRPRRIQLRLLGLRALQGLLMDPTNIASVNLVMGCSKGFFFSHYSNTILTP